MPPKFSQVDKPPDELRQDNDWPWLFEQVIWQYLEGHFEETSQRFHQEPTIWQKRYEEWLYRIFIPFGKQVGFQDQTLRALIAKTLKAFLIVRHVKSRLTGSSSPES